MFGSHVLETAIGLAFIYLVLSVFASTINEWIAAMFSFRSKDLEILLKNLLGQTTSGEQAERALAAAASSSGASTTPTANVPATTTPDLHSSLATALLQHPAIDNLRAPKLFGKGLSKLSYLDSDLFSSTLLDLVAPDSGNSLDKVKAGVAGLQNDELRKTLLPLINKAGNDIDKARMNIASWYDHAMERLSGRYKRRAQIFLFVIGLALAIGLNMSTIDATKKLWTDPVVREQMLEEAKKAAPPVQNAATPPGNATDDLKKKTEQLQNDYTSLQTAYANAGIPFGWSADARTQFAGNLSWDWSKVGALVIILLGWIMTATAVSFGAPFWFDFLNQVLKLNTRLSGSKPKPADAKA